MSQKYSNQTLLSLKEGDKLYLSEINDLGKSIMTITDIFEDAIGGIVHFYEAGGFEEAEYGELYEQDFSMVYNVEINN